MMKHHSEFEGLFNLCQSQIFDVCPLASALAKLYIPSIINTHYILWPIFEPKVHFKPIIDKGQLISKCILVS